MSEEEQPNKKKREDQDDTFYSDVLDALDSALDSGKSPQTEKSQLKADEANATEEGPQVLFPFAPDLNDPNFYPDFQGAKFYVDTRNYYNAINTLINILRVPQTTTDKNMASELILELAKTAPEELHPLLPYLVLTQGIDDPIIEMNINNALMYLREDYNMVTGQIKEAIKSYIEAYYSEFNTTYIPFMDILNGIGTSIELIIKVLDQMSKDREIKGKLDYTTQVFAYEPPGALFTCPYCGVEIDKDAKFCKNCHEDVYKCAICFRFIHPDEFTQCPKCDATAHEQHFLEWVKKTGTCPVCQNKLYEQEVAKIRCVVCDLEISKDDKNTTKCPHCGALAHIDHLLDYIKISNACPECKKKLNIKELKKALKKK
ncbi:MAG: hypothetical protein HWN65_02035 [Candidatus Helarchaeota archaeon]|nr:hypothetical protein [Candidatus Helarchaeota archaeon]